MNWLERYVEGVKRYLPQKKREDVGEEIKSVLTDKREAEEEKLGREMNEKELGKWITTQEHPMVLAAGYMERRELVTAELFPLYILALKISLAIVFGLKVLSAGFYILGPGEFEFSYIWGKLFGGLIENGLMAFASVTVVFHFLGKHISAKKFFENWSLSILPKSGAKWMTVPVGETIFEIIAYVFTLGVLQFVLVKKWGSWWDDKVFISPDLLNLVVWVQVVIALFLVHRLWLVIRPQWNISKLATNIVLTAFGFYVLTLVLGVDPMVQFDQALVTDHPGLNRTEWITRIIRVGLYITGAVYIYEMGRDLYRMYQLNR